LTQYERLLDDIAQSAVAIIPTKSHKQPAKSMRIGHDYAIFFNETAYETDAERVVEVVHEKAHCDSGALYCIDSPFEMRERCEYRAWKRAVHDFLPVEKLLEACRACMTAEGVAVYDLAEYLGVTPAFVVKAIEVYTLREWDSFYCAGRVVGKV